MSQSVIDEILQSPRLPSLPSIALEVIDLVQQPDVDINQIANTIQNDPALSSKILKTVNSSFYGQAYTVSTISHALVVLGLNSVKTLALGFSLVSNLQESGGEGFDHIRYWKRSIYAASAAKRFAKEQQLVQQEEVFLGALLQDLGMLAMNQVLGKEYTEMLNESDGCHDKLLELEQEKYQMTHADVGAELANSWKLPPLLITPIRYHETPDEVQAEFSKFVRCVALGGTIADLFINEADGHSLEKYLERAELWFSMTHDQAEGILHEISQDTNELQRLFDMPADDFANVDDILAKANEALMNITLQSQMQHHELTQHANELREKNELLVNQANTDSLTGVANRRKFNDYIAQEFSLSKENGAGPLSVLFLDTDHFKKFNDTYGHPVGDRVLVALSRTLEDVIGDGGLVARYGGEEFAIVLPNKDRRSAAVIAENARAEIEKTTVLSDEDKELHITASIGVATYEGVFFDRVETLVKAADQGVYAAKNSGRNCVRIFTPRAA
ncbi:GGDEF domain-containing protein [Planctomycetota bacterium]|nr:GGDEF domain-containing protein [Planctomycetota bacterium]